LHTTTLNQLQRLSEEDVFRLVLPPRLKLFTFVAEHDDHHLAKIASLALSK
jgi:hypothetical protein